MVQPDVRNSHNFVISQISCELLRRFASNVDPDLNQIPSTFQLFLVAGVITPSVNYLAASVTCDIWEVCSFYDIHTTCCCPSFWKQYCDKPPTGACSLVSKRNHLSRRRLQRGNPVLECIRNVGKEFGDILADYQVGRTTGVLFLRY